MKMNVKYENLVTLIFGAWILLLPLGVGPIEGMKTNVYMWNLFFTGLAVMIMSFMAMKRMLAWAETLTLFSGVWLIISPLLLFYFDKSNIYFWNSIVCGGLISFFAALALPETDKVVYHKTNVHYHILERSHKQKHHRLV